MMIKTCQALGIFAAFLSCGTISAQVNNQYPFNAPEFLLAPASEFSAWATTLARHDEQQIKLYACGQDRTKCRGRLRSFAHMMDKAQALNLDEQISLVHFYVNRSRYDDDHPKRIFDHSGKKIGVQRNHWSTLYDFLLQGGDCEDYATAKYFMLRALGFTADQLRVVVTYERGLRGHHAVLAVQRPDQSVWLLDSDNRIRKKSHRGYRYVYAMNEMSVWDYRPEKK